jgi:hypothetical protein
MTTASLRPAPVLTTIEVAVYGGGAIGSRVVALLPGAIVPCVLDNQLVRPENLETSRFAAEDCFQPKAIAAAARRVATGAAARAIHGDVRYAASAGLARAISALLVCLDNVTAIRDAVETVWGAGIRDLPMIVLGCGNASTGGGYQARVFVSGRERACPICNWGRAERDADRAGSGASCAITSAPRATAEAAEAAAVLGVRLLERWLDGDRSAAGMRIQGGGAGGEYAVRMPAAPAARCPVPHHPPTEVAIDLDGGIDALTVGALAERARAAVGDDAEIVLGRRAVPMVGMSCTKCHLVGPAPLRLLPAAAGSCACGGELGPIATRSRVSVRELLAPDVAPLTLRGFGCPPGDELLAVGARGAARLRTRFHWGR